MTFCFNMAIAEIQAVKLETTVYRLMARSGNNPELVNTLSDLAKIISLLSQNMLLWNHDQGTTNTNHSKEILASLAHAQ